MNIPSPRTRILEKLNRLPPSQQTQMNGHRGQVQFASSQALRCNLSSNGACVEQVNSMAEAIALIKILSQRNHWTGVPVFAGGLMGLARRSGVWTNLGNDPSMDGSIGVSQAYCAIADTGTLVFLSSAEYPTGLNFLPEHHVAIMDANRIVLGKKDVWSLMRQEEVDTPRALNLISGPSRTADIEQTIQLGAHGPRSLTVILVGTVNLSAELP